MAAHGIAVPSLNAPIGRPDKKKKVFFFFFGRGGQPAELTGSEDGGLESDSDLNGCQSHLCAEEQVLAAGRWSCTSRRTTTTTIREAWRKS